MSHPIYILESTEKPCDVVLSSYEAISKLFDGSNDPDFPNAYYIQGAPL